MANSISSNTTITSVVDGVRTSVSNNQSTQTSSSNFLAGSQQVTSSAWTNLSFSQLNDVFMLTVVNDNSQYSQSVVQVYSGSNGTGGGILANLPPGGQAVIPWSGSLTTVSVKVIGSYSGGAFSPTVVQSGQGDVQFLAQQS